jgi:hypothetical protein
MSILKDEQRSYFGLGWEYARQGKPIKDFLIKTGYAFEQFCEGFNSYRKSEKADYSNINIDLTKFHAQDNLLAIKG